MLLLQVAPKPEEGHGATAALHELIILPAHGIRAELGISSIEGC